MATDARKHWDLGFLQQPFESGFGIQAIQDKGFSVLALGFRVSGAISMFRVAHAKSMKILSFGGICRWKFLTVKNV